MRAGLDSHQQRLRLSDLRHFRRRRDLGHFRGRRKAYERRREDGVGIEWAAGRLIELGQRQCGAQFEAARGLLLRDGDGGQERCFRRRGIGGVAFEQGVAARPMQFGFECAIAQTIRCRQRLVKNRDRPVDVPCLGFGFSKSNLDGRIEHEDILLAQEIDTATHIL